SCRPDHNRIRDGGRHAARRGNMAGPRPCRQLQGQRHTRWQAGGRPRTGSMTKDRKRKSRNKHPAARCSGGFSVASRGGVSSTTDVIRWDENAGPRRDAVRSQVIDVLEAQIKRRPAMKKVSTAAAKQSRNISRQKLTIGLDLGDRNSWYCVLDEAGRIQLEQRVRTTAKAMQEVFGAMPRSRIALEIGTHSPWISRLLSDLGHEVIVANARKVRLIGESRKKDDRLDAQTLARLARIDH